MSRKINLNQELVRKGYWYLPSVSDSKVAGVLTYLPNEKIELELIGSFENSLEDIFEGYGEAVTIYGNTSEAEEITLFECFKSSKFNFSADFPIVKYTCRYMAIGKHINGLDEKGQYKASIRIPELTHWCYPDALETSHKCDKESGERKLYISFRYQYKNNENIINEVQVDENTTIRIKKGVDYESSNLQLTPFIEQLTYIEFQKLKITSIRELIDDICKFEEFLSLATLSNTESTDITLYDEGLFQLEGDEKYNKEINLIHPFNKVPIATDKRHRKYLFYYNAIKEFYPTLLSKWYNAPKDLLPIRAHLLDSIKKPIQNSVDFLIIIQAIEGFWWRFRDAEYRIRNSIPKKKETSLNTILTELIAEFSDIDAIKNSGMNKVGVVDSRHYYSHFLLETKKPEKLEGTKLIKEAKKLKTLLISCILSFIGMENSQINKLFPIE